MTASRMVFATPGGDDNHPWAWAFVSALQAQIDVEYCLAELSDQERAIAERTVPSSRPLMRKIMVERSEAAAEMRRARVKDRLQRGPRRWLHLQLYTNDVLPLDCLEAVYTDIFLGMLEERGADVPGFDWDAEFLEQALQRERTLLTHCRRVYVTSEWVADYGRRKLGLGDRIVVAGVGAVVAPEEPPGRRDPLLPPRLVFIGNDAERKGLDLVLAAYARIRTVLPNVELSVVGRARVESDLPVMWHGYIDARTHEGCNRLSSILSDATLFLLPTRFDPVAIAFLDAMSHSLPIIGPRDCMVPEYLEEGVTGRFCKRDAEDIARVVLECLRDPAACLAMGSRARDVQQRDYRWDCVVRRILDDWRDSDRGERTA